ncbi:M23 family metallopeptidase [Microbacterium sp. LRZ72]|uniref:M23 family metallopeptidase n=1 Tax=Microbacterium sp. LRZ72 TaxID=2942481 RepID=UPI0029A9A9A2|nr:M23 family metallopeptidase [Microbacterium sp. LRZ72]MDX2377841.1 M23 family metallopeptidase [Microbacterium sp. LRZ72]
MSETSRGVPAERTPVERTNADPACGCAPTGDELTALGRPRRPVSRRRMLGMGALGVLALGSVGAVAGPLLPAFAADYPSWDDVQQAKRNQSSKAAEVSRIQGLIASLTERVARTQAAAEQAANEFYEAEEAFYAAAARAEDLQSQADAQAAEAIAASERAGRVASQLYRDGGDDTSLELFFSGSPDGAEDLLGRLGTMDKVLERNRETFAEAITARDSAQSLSDQAQVARDERDRLKQVAEEKMVASQEAALAAEQALEEQSEHLIVLEAQLSALQDETAETVAGYEAGVEARRRAEAAARRRAEAEARRLAEEARKRREAEEAANNSGGGGGGSSGGSSGGGGGQTSGSGWARPSGGWSTSRYGARPTICTPGYGCTGFHNGTDMATGCGAGVFAAGAGRVVFATGNGQFGNHIRIDHGGGIITTYSHMSALVIGYGSRVSAGQLIGREGRTGLSQGCHLHFEVVQNGRRINPEPFMAQRGVSI